MLNFNSEQIQKINSHITLGNISKIKHPIHPIYILTYSKQCQYDNAWDEVTMKCRGLVIDEDYNIISHAMIKFHNDFELERAGIKIPVLPFDAYEKVDGSLIYLFNYNDEWIFISKGSFQSDQCIEAKKIFGELYRYEWLVKHITYGFEIIYPQNRIVIDYGDRRDLVALTMFDNNDGIEIPFVAEPFHIVKKYDGMNDVSAIKAQFNHLPGQEFEGIVIRFNSGFRMKIKMDDYFRLHRLLSGLSAKSIWEMMSTNMDIESFKSTVQDEEINHWIDTTVAEFQLRYSEIEERCKFVVESIRSKTTDKKSFALEALQCDYPSVLFNMNNGKRYNEVIWDILKPKGVSQIFRKLDE